MPTCQPHPMSALSCRGYAAVLWRVGRMALLGAWLLMLTLLPACDRGRPVFEALPPDAIVLVLGDSLVAGTGAGRAQAWPRVLARSTGWRVINAGVPGDTSGEALARLPGLLAEHQPDAVIIAIGGNDFLRRLPLKTTRRNLREIIVLSRAGATQVALMAVPATGLSAAFGHLEDHEMFAELADEHELVLIPDVIATVLSRPDWRADAIHANAEGYARMAELVRIALARQGWLKE